MCDYNNCRDDVVDEDEICKKHTCDNCPLFEKCYDISDEIEDDYETLTPDELIDKYVK